MINLITDKELEEFKKLLDLVNVTRLNVDLFNRLIELLNKLLNSYRYYKKRVSELELQIEDLLDRDLI